MKTNIQETRAKKLIADTELIKKYKTYEHAISSLQMILDNHNGYWMKSNDCLSDLGQKIVIDCMGQAGWKVNPEFPKISRKYVRKLNEVLSKCPFSKERAISFIGNLSSATKPSEEESKSFWDWILGY